MTITVLFTLLGLSGPADELMPPVRLEAAGKVIDTAVGHAAPFVGDFDGDGRLDLLVGDFATQAPDRPDPTAAEKVEQEKLRKELDKVMEQYRGLIDKVVGNKRLTDDKERAAAQNELSSVSHRMMGLRQKLPPEYENHGWIWLFMRKPAGAPG